MCLLADKPNVKTLIEHAAKLHQLGNTAGALDTYNEAAGTTTPCLSWCTF